MVVVPKKGGKWRVCVDYTSLNDPCPKDNFLLPRIDQIVDASSGHGMLSFLVAFSGYHQILMYPSNAEKIVFITPHGLFCYNVMSFRLKNAEVTRDGIEAFVTLEQQGMALFELDEEPFNYAICINLTIAL